jgi:hypothetical protein
MEAVWSDAGTLQKCAPFEAPQTVFTRGENDKRYRNLPEIEPFSNDPDSFQKWTPLLEMDTA